MNDEEAYQQEDDDAATNDGKSLQSLPPDLTPSLQMPRCLPHLELIPARVTPAISVGHRSIWTSHEPVPKFKAGGYPTQNKYKAVRHGLQ
jgi:hypothetical protein